MTPNIHSRYALHQIQTRTLTMRAQFLEHTHDFCTLPNYPNKVHSSMHENVSSTKSRPSAGEINTNIDK